MTARAAYPYKAVNDVAKPKHRTFTVLINTGIFILLFLFHYSVSGSIAIKNATPFLMLPMLTAFSMFYGTSAAFWAGLACGTAADGIVNGTSIFSTTVLTVTAVLTSLIAQYLFNRNIRAAVVLSLTGNVFYFLMRWLVFYAFGNGITDSVLYLMDYALPSAVYSTVFIIPFYFLEKYLYNKTN